MIINVEVDCVALGKASIGEAAVRIAVTENCGVAELDARTACS